MVWGLALGSFSFAPARYDFGALRWLSAGPIIRLGEASYLIYLTHMLIFLIMCGSQGPLPGDLASSVYLYARLFAAARRHLLVIECVVYPDRGSRASRAASCLAQAGFPD